MNRNDVCIYLGYILIAFTALGANSVLAGQGQEWRFKVYLDDKWIGYHNFRLTRQGNGNHQLDIDAQFDVKFLFINAYRYRHSNTEQWQRQCLKSIHSSTEDNGNRFTVRGAINGDRFYLNNGTGRTALPNCVMSFAYWDPAILKADRLLNAQTGKYVDITVMPLGQQQILVRDQPVLATRYRLFADKAVIDLWYSTDSYRWLALQSTTDGGRKIRYLMD
jgi:hypothetical protein